MRNSNRAQPVERGSPAAPRFRPAPPAVAPAVVDAEPSRFLATEPTGTAAER